MSIYIFCILSDFIKTDEQEELHRTLDKLISGSCNVNNTVSRNVLCINGYSTADDALKEGLLILQKLDNTGLLKMFMHQEKNLHLCDEICRITREYETPLVISHSVFAQLSDPNAFNYRFLGRFEGNGTDDSIALFEFFDAYNRDIRKLKIDTKPCFEDSVFNFFGKRTAQSIAGFRNVLKLNPEDRASEIYILRAENMLNDNHS